MSEYDRKLEELIKGATNLSDQSIKRAQALLKNAQKEIIAEALIIAQSLRPERYTILKQIKMTHKKALELAKSTNVI